MLSHTSPNQPTKQQNNAKHTTHGVRPWGRRHSGLQSSQARVTLHALAFWLPIQCHKLCFTYWAPRS